MYQNVSEEPMEFGKAMKKTVVCVIPRDCIERALKSESSIVDDCTLNYSEFIELSVTLINHIGIENLSGIEEHAKSLWYRTMTVYGWMDVGDSTEESELIAYASFTYARYLAHHYPLYNMFSGKEMSFELKNGDVEIYGY